MLYNKDWDKKKGELTLDALIAWLEQQPRNMTYCACDPVNCLLGQWTKSIDRSSISNGTIVDGVINTYTYVVNNKVVDLSVLQPVIFNNGHTFGGALEVARNQRRVRGPENYEKGEFSATVDHI
jgi:hypothetical protein